MQSQKVRRISNFIAFLCHYTGKPVNVPWETKVIKEFFTFTFISHTMVAVVTLELSMYYLFVQHNTNGEQH